MRRLLVLAAAIALVACGARSSLDAPKESVSDPVPRAACSGAATIDLGSATHHCTNLAFAPSRTSMTDELTGIGAGDFNGDGALDLLINENQNDVVLVMLGAGDGTFSMGPTSATGVTPVAAAVADFDADGRLDVAVANQGSNNVSVLHGKGDGAFASGELLALDSRPVALVASDVNADGSPDLLVALPDSQHVAVALVGCDGKIGAPIVYDAGAAVALATADLDANGTADIIAVDALGGLSPQSRLAVLLGNGDGTFGAMKPHAGVERGTSVVASDFNRDGRVDVAVATNPDATVGAIALLLWGNGDGTFTDGPSYGVPWDVRAIAVADMDADGHADIVTASYAGTMSVLPGNGDGTFAMRRDFASLLQNDPVGPSLAIADFDGDGRMDTALTGLVFRSLFVMKNTCVP